jgi:hypothetical protein
MALDELISSAPATTRRKFVGTGVKIAYAAPVIAASFKIGVAEAAVVSGVAQCTDFNCGGGQFCNGAVHCDTFNRLSCICSHSVDNVPFCGDWCFSCGGGTGAGCTSDSQCAPGSYCSDTCCGTFCISSTCGSEGPIANEAGAVDPATGL